MNDARRDGMGPRLTMSTHNAEHVVLSAAQRLDVQNLNEAFASLVRKSDAISTAAASWSLDAFGRPWPSKEEQQAFFELHREFFDLTYSTLSRLAACLNRLTKLVQGVRWNSNERFLGWLREENPSREYARYLDVLLEARNFRTIYTHPGQWKPVDWRTEGAVPFARVVLEGVHPPLPPGVYPDNNSGKWVFPAPVHLIVLWAFERVAFNFFGRIESFYEPDEERCTWEADGLGSAPGIALENQAGMFLARPPENGPPLHL